MITFANQYEMFMWGATVHAYLTGKNALSDPILKDAANGADKVVAMMRSRTPVAIGLRNPPSTHDVQSNEASPPDASNPIVAAAMNLGKAAE